jgi:hypothetical protein
MTSTWLRRVRRWLGIELISLGMRVHGGEWTWQVRQTEPAP